MVLWLIVLVTDYTYLQPNWVESEAGTVTTFKSRKSKATSVQSSKVGSSIASTSRIAVDEIEALLKAKLKGAGHHELKNAWKNNDPDGKGFGMGCSYIILKSISYFTVCSSWKWHVMSSVWFFQSFWIVKYHWDKSNCSFSFVWKSIQLVSASYSHLIFTFVQRLHWQGPTWIFISQLISKIHVKVVIWHSSNSTTYTATSVRKTTMASLNGLKAMKQFLLLIKFSLGFNNHVITYESYLINRMY